MRRAANFLIPVTLITLYYALWSGGAFLLLDYWPELREIFPLGGLGELAERTAARSADNRSFETGVFHGAGYDFPRPAGPVRLALASVGAAIMIIPVSWAYFITSRNKEVDQSFVQTIVILPIVVTGLSMIVQNSIALAFSPRRYCRSRAFSLYAAATGARDVHIRVDQHRACRGNRCPRHRADYFDGIRLRDADYLEARIRQTDVRSVLYDVDAARQYD